MAVDPNAQLGLPPGIPPPGPGGPMPPGLAAPGLPPGAGGGPPAGAPMLPTTDPQAMMGVLEAMRAQDMATVQQQQDGALATAVSQLLRQTPNQPGLDATTMPGEPVPPSLPGGNPGDPSAGMGSGAGY